MFCGKCGNKIETDASFCPFCGSAIEKEKEEPVVNSNPILEKKEEVVNNVVSNEVKPEPVVSQGESPVKRIIKKWWVWVIVGVVTVGLVITIVSCANSCNSSSSSSYSSSFTYESPYVTLVKNTTNSKYSITYGKAFSKFFTSPKWEYFEAVSGEHVVEFTGKFSYDGAPATAKIQFIVGDDYIQVYHLSINGQDQNKLMLGMMIQKIFESYY